MRSRIHLLLIAATCAAFVLVGIVVWADRMKPVTIAISSVEPHQIQVSISGAVATPGVVELSSGSRLRHVLDAAGGPLPDADLSSLNLAGRVGDGEEIVIPSTSSPSPEASYLQEGTGLININSASAEELVELPGVGEVIAGRIIHDREQNGPYASIEELDRVEGISMRLVDELRPLVTVGAGD